MGPDDWEDLCRDVEGEWEWIDGTIADPHDDSGGLDGEERGKKTNGKEKGIVNEFGEKVGIARLKEALEANEWESITEGNDGADEYDGYSALELELGIAGEESVGKRGFSEEAEEARGEIFSLSSAIRNGDTEGDEEEDVDEAGDKIENEGDDDEVQGLETMMLKLQAAKDLGADMPEVERRKFAAKAVREAMKSV